VFLIVLEELVLFIRKVVGLQSHLELVCRLRQDI